ncbi:helix-turn-helix domain-containing protein [Cohaesibacter sp. CAU 1516]|uniref:helix-turn-helix domain-containing protein n=1 Tax=Cohaesibacter sp. CAU 1516 TaxID=2576038 RepID=UPI001FEE8B1C|nr:helix-turn-helix domain-containing protein [Cohaesibacter sp. CAU 1516]
MTKALTMQPQTDAIQIAVLAFDGMSPFHLWVPTTVFGRIYESDGRYKVTICAEQAGPIMTSDGMILSVPHGFDRVDNLGQGDMVIVPTWPNIDQQPSPALITCLQAAHDRGAILVGLCLGAFVLAEAGLLAGKRATTHWAYADAFAKRYPDIACEPDQLYADEGDVVTSAGVAAGLDCCLYLMRKQIGVEAANRTARNLVVSPHRAGGQAQYIERPVPKDLGESRVADVMVRIRNNLKEPHSIDKAAAHARMSRRTFTRHFANQTGTSFTRWLLSERLALSQLLLETTSLSMESVAYEAGFGSTMSLRHHFRQAFGLPPGAWRKQFKGTA